jgi:hypothetical protein
MFLTRETADSFNNQTDIPDSNPPGCTFCYIARLMSIPTISRHCILAMPTNGQLAKKLMTVQADH